MSKSGQPSLHGIIRGLLFAALYAIALMPLAAAEPSKLAATSYGAAGEVTGSLHVLDTGNGRWMIDCGSVIDENDAEQPVDEAVHNVKRGQHVPQTLPKGVESVLAVFITHAHADHLGRLPLLIDRGFRGPIYMTEATAALAVPAIRVGLRRDQTTVRSWSWSKERRVRSENTGKSLYVHWRDCKYRKEFDAQSAEQATCSFQKLFDRFANQVPQVHATLCCECVSDQIAAILRNVRTVKYGVATDVSPGVRVTFLDAGHIPGAASILFEVTLGEKKHLPSPFGRGAGGEG